PGQTESDCSRKGRLAQVGEATERFYAKIPDRKAWWRARKILQRQGISRRDFLTTVLAAASLAHWPVAKIEREELAWRTLHNIRTSVAEGDDALIRGEVSALEALILQIKGPNDRFAEFLQTHCETIRRDLGALTFGQALKQAQRVSQKWG